MTMFFKVELGGKNVGSFINQKGTSCSIPGNIKYIKTWNHNTVRHTCVPGTYFPPDSMATKNLDSDDVMYSTYFIPFQ